MAETIHQVILLRIVYISKWSMQLKWWFIFEILDSRETGGNSVAMEREGLRRLLERLSKTLPFSELVTDASTTIMKLVRETKGNNINFYVNLVACFMLLSVIQRVTFRWLPQFLSAY